jgi:3-oxosteroid 1-dehydrogenase
MTEVYDVVVVGSGSAGMTAAATATNLGLSVLVLEKTHKYGGTSATSGGVMWLPANGLGGDTREEALRYLHAAIREPVREDRLEAFVDNSAKMLEFLRGLGIKFEVAPWPDYFPELEGARSDRAVIFPLYDGRKLGDNFPLMREQFTRFKLFNRYTMDFTESFSISTQSPGWIKTLARVLGRYWTDLSTRKLTGRDRWLSLGGALIGPLRKYLNDQGVEVRLASRVTALERNNGRVEAVEVDNFGRRYRIEARHAVIVCAGGFEWNQALRDRFFVVPGLTRWSSTPEDANRGEVMEAAMAIGAAVEYTETGWWVPTMHQPMPKASNFEEIHQAVFDVGRPHSVCVNRLGRRFVDEACGYDRFGSAMVADQKKTGANTPCWLVFDATFRRKFTAGGIMPSQIMPDSKVPVDFWDQYIFRAPTIRELAEKIHIDVAALERTVANMNGYAATGVDPEFGRGNNIYDRNFGDFRLKPNPCLGTIKDAPFYAVPINLGDLGTKGGLKADARGQVLDTEGKPIPGLYAAGNASGSPFGDCYPGAGGTIGPAMVFGFLAGLDVAAQGTNRGPRRRSAKPALSA